eukprot:g3152.t1
MSTPSLPVLKRMRSTDKSGKTLTFQERIQQKEQKILEYAQELSRSKVSRKSKSNKGQKEAWEKIRWGIDVVIQMLDTPKKKLGKSGGITIKFQMALNGIAASIMKHSNKSGEGPQNVLKNVQILEGIFDDYLINVVRKSIQEKKGTERLQEFVKRWENHKIFCEYIRRLFLCFDKGAVQGNATSIPAMGVLKFKDILWKEIGRKEIVETMLTLVDKHRRGQCDQESRSFLLQCTEVICTMGVVDANHFHQIKQFVDINRANKGIFVIPKTIPCLGAMDEMFQSEAHQIVVAKHIKLYKREFEKPFLKSSTAYFTRMRDDMLSVKSIHDYLETIESKILKEERERCSGSNAYLNSSTEEPLVKECVKCMLAEPIQTRLIEDSESGLMATMRKEKKPGSSEDLKRMYRLFKLVDRYDFDGGLKPIAKVFGAYIEAEGHVLNVKRRNRLEKVKKQRNLRVFDPAHDPLYVDNILALYMRCKTIRDDDFGGEAIFNKHMNLSFSKVMNHNWGDGRNQTETFLVYYMNMLLNGKYKGKNASPNLIKRVCSDVLELLDYCDDKLVFTETYKSLLGVRLLNPKYKEYTNETDILSKLKLKVGGTETSSMEAMLREITASREARDAWKSSAEFKKAGGGGGAIEAFDPLVLSDTNWTLPANTLKMKTEGMSSQAQQWIQRFETYYGHKHDSRQLLYRYDLSTAVLEYKAPKGKKKHRISMTVPQASLLMAFTTRDKEVSIQDMQKQLQIETHHIKAILLTMLRHPTKDATSGLLMQSNLEKGEKPMPIKNTACFRLSPNFETKYLKFDLPEPSLRGATRNVRPQRNWRLEAALVRTMKTHRKMKERALMKEAMSQVDHLFKPEVKDVKRCVEGLIKKDYMKRDKEDAETLHYVN